MTTTLGTTGRLAFRNLRRSRGLYLTIGLLIAIPVAIGVTSAIALRSAGGSPERFFEDRYGSSEFVLDFHSEQLVGSDVDRADGGTINAIKQDIESAGGEVLVRRSTYAQAPLALEVAELSYQSPLATPILRTLAGRAPNRPGEIMLTRAALEQNNVAVGDRLSTFGDNSVLVVGSLDWSNSWEQIGFVAPGLLPDGGPDSPFMNVSIGIRGLSSQRIETIVDDHIPGSPTRPWSTEVDPASYFETIDPGGRPEQAGTLIAGALLVEAALLAGAAFAVGARRRVTEFGRLSAIGADSGQITAIMATEAFFVSLAGAAGGAAAALAFTFGPGGLFEGLATWLGGQQVTGTEIHPLDVLGPMVVAVVAGIVACWWPAKRASQLSTVTALAAGSHRQNVPLRLVPLSFGLFVLTLITIALASSTSFNGDGGLTTVLAVAAVITAALTILGFSTIIVGSMATKRIMVLPTFLRLAVRESARHRQRTVAALSGAAFLLAGVVYAMTFIVSASEPTTPAAAKTTSLVTSSNDSWSIWLDLADPSAERPDPQSVVPDAAAIEIGMSGGGFGLGPIDSVVFYEFIERDRQQPGVFSSSTEAIVADDQLLALLGVPTEVRRVLERPGFGLYVGSQAVDGQFTATILGSTSVEEDQDVVDPATFDQRPERRLIIDTETYPIPELADLGFQLVIGPTTVEALELPEPIRGELLYEADGFDGTELAALTELGVRTPFGVGGEVGDPQTTFRLIVLPQLIALAVIAVILAILYRIIGGLVAVETERDLATMVSIGGPQHVRRRQLGAQAFVSLVVAIVIAVPIGFATAVVTNESGWQPLDIDVPWVLLAGLGLLPVVVAAVMAATIRDSPPAMSRRLA